MTQSFWSDEAFSYLLAKRSLIEIIKLTGRDFNPPLYYLLLHYWLKIFGPSEIALRSLSFIFFAATIYVVFLFLKNIFHVKGRRIYIYLLLFSLNPPLLYFAFEARMYSLFAFLAGLSFYYFYKKERVPYLIATIAGLYTHYFFLFVVATQILYLILQRQRTLLKSTIIALLVFAPWFIIAYPTLTTKTSAFWIKPLAAKDFISSLGILFTGYESGYQYYNLLIAMVSLFFVVFTIRFLLVHKKKPPLLIMLLLWSFLFYLLLVVISLKKPLFVYRYFIFATVGFNLLIFYMMEHVNKKTRLLLLIVLFTIVVHYTRLEVLHKRKGDVRRTIKAIRALAGNQDLLYVAESKLYLPASYYFDEKRTYIYDGQPVPYYVGAAVIPKEKMVYHLPSYPQKAFILKNDTAYDIQATY